MPLPDEIRRIQSCPGMYFSPITFDAAASLLYGFDMASHGGLLTGFKEWLVVRADHGDNFTWSALAQRLILAASTTSCADLHHQDNQQFAVDSLFNLLSEFWDERHAKMGLRKSFRSYEVWLERQDWYNSRSPAYLGDDRHA